MPQVVQTLKSLSSVALLAVSQLLHDVTDGELLSAVQEEAMTAEGEAFLGEYLLPLIAGAIRLASFKSPFASSAAVSLANLARSGWSAAKKVSLRWRTGGLPAFD